MPKETKKPEQKGAIIPKDAKPKKDPFKETIQNYLNKRAEEDELFAVTLKKENKSIDNCINYIYRTVKDSGRQGFNDDEIFGMAVHYYDEDDIKLGSGPSGKVIVNQSLDLSEEEKALAKEKAIEKFTEELKDEVKQELAGTIELTEEEKADARRIALAKAVDEQKERLTAKKKPVKQAEPAPESTGLFSEELF